MSKKEKAIYSVLGTIVFLTMILGFSYAYMYAVILNAEEDTTLTIKSADGGLALIFTDGEDTMSPTDIAPGWWATKTFKVENLTTSTQEYNLYFNDIENTFLNKSDLVYSISSTNGGGSKSETSLPTVNEEVISNISIGAGVTQEYTLTVKYLNNPNVNQIADVGKRFSFQIFI